MTESLTVSDRSRLDAAARAAVAEDRHRLCGDLPQVRMTKAGYPKYEGGYLGLGNLSTLVAQKILSWSALTEWSEETLQRALRPDRPDKALPLNLTERQLLLEAIGSVMANCFRKAAASGRSVGHPHDYVAFLGAEPKDLNFNELDFNPNLIGFFQLTEWNAGRRLDEDLNVGVVQEVAHREAQDWVDPDLLRTYLDEAHNTPGSLCPTLVGYEIDTREGQGQELIIKVAQSRYYRNVAIGKCLREHPGLYERIAEKVHRLVPGESGLDSLISRAPDSNIAINVTVSSSSGEVLLIKRPGNARTWAGYYQVGPHETMNSPAPGTRYHENCFELARRALWEEVKLGPADLAGPIVFSWFGYYLPEAQGYFFAHAQTVLSKNEIVRKARTAHSAFEIGNIEWMIPDRPTVERVLATWSDGPWNPGHDEYGRTYLPHAAISLSQLHRIISQGMMPNR